MGSKNSIDFKGEERYKEIRRRNRVFLYLAYSVFFLSIVAGFGFAIHYFSSNTLEYGKNSDIGTFATFLSGTVGLLITASSICFLIYTLRIQNESLLVSLKDVEISQDELRISNDNFIKQKKDNIFFNLLEYHSKLVTNIGPERIQESYEKISSSLNIYMESLHTRTFRHYNNTRYNPQMLNEDDIIFKPLIKNITHIIKYIKQTLEDDPFFHETLNNILTDGEKYYLGMLHCNSIIKFDELTGFKGYDYFFRNTSLYTNFGLNGVFPIIELSPVQTHATNYTQGNPFDAIGNLLLYRIQLIKAYNEQQVFYRGFTVQIKHMWDKTDGPIFPFQDNKILEARQPYEVNYYLSTMKDFFQEIWKDAPINVMHNFRIIVQVKFTTKIFIGSKAPDDFKIRQSFKLDINKGETNSITLTEDIY